MTPISTQDHGLRLWRGSVLPQWLDYNGHMTEFRYLEVFGESSDALYAKIGVLFDAAETGAFFTLQTHLRHIAECKLGAQLYTETQILGYDEKRLHLWHQLFEEGGKLLATGEHLTLHMAHGKSGPAALAMQQEIAAIYRAQLQLPRPPEAGSVLRKPLRYMRNA